MNEDEVSYNFDIISLFFVNEYYEKLYHEAKTLTAKSSAMAASITNTYKILLQNRMIAAENIEGPNGFIITTSDLRKYYTDYTQYQFSGSEPFYKHFISIFVPKEYLDMLHGDILYKAIHDILQSLTKEFIDVLSKNLSRIIDLRHERLINAETFKNAAIGILTRIKQVYTKKFAAVKQNNDEWKKRYELKCRELDLITKKLKKYEAAVLKYESLIKNMRGSVKKMPPSDVKDPIIMSDLDDLGKELEIELQSRGLGTANTTSLKPRFSDTNAQNNKLDAAERSDNDADIIQNDSILFDNVEDNSAGADDFEILGDLIEKRGGSIEKEPAELDEKEIDDLIDSIDKIEDDAPPSPAKVKERKKKTSAADVDEKKPPAKKSAAGRGRKKSSGV